MQLIEMYGAVTFVWTLHVFFLQIFADFGIQLLYYIVFTFLFFFCYYNLVYFNPLSIKENN